MACDRPCLCRRFVVSDARDSEVGLSLGLQGRGFGVESVADALKGLGFGASNLEPGGFKALDLAPVPYPRDPKPKSLKIRL